MTYPQTGSVIPMHTSCIGKLLCAYTDNYRLHELLESYEFKALTKNSISSKENFINELKMVRSMGISFDLIIKNLLQGLQVLVGQYSTIPAKLLLHLL